MTTVSRGPKRSKASPVGICPSAEAKNIAPMIRATSAPEKPKRTPRSAAITAQMHCMGGGAMACRMIVNLP
jgi:hypothetical protein